MSLRVPRWGTTRKTQAGLEGGGGRHFLDLSLPVTGESNDTLADIAGADPIVIPDHTPFIAVLYFEGHYVDPDLDIAALGLRPVIVGFEDMDQGDAEDLVGSALNGQLGTAINGDASGLLFTTGHVQSDGLPYGLNYLWQGLAAHSDPDPVPLASNPVTLAYLDVTILS